MRIPQAPRLIWSIVVYYLLLFLAGVAWVADETYYTPSTWEPLRGGLWLLILTHFFFFVAPWIHQSWIAWAIVVLVPLGIAFASAKLVGWVRWISVMTLIVCLNIYSMYVVMLTGG